MKEYDLIVVGSGAGMIGVSRGTRAGMKVAVVDRGPMGGTCLNNGCIPSKVLIYPADFI
jgi:dihydrolipoamide dehydrogenase